MNMKSLDKANPHTAKASFVMGDSSDLTNVPEDLGGAVTVERKTITESEGENATDVEVLIVRANLRNANVSVDVKANHWVVLKEDGSLSVLTPEEMTAAYV